MYVRNPELADITHMGVIAIIHVAMVVTGDLLALQVQWGHRDVPAQWARWDLAGLQEPQVQAEPLARRELQVLPAI